MMYAPKELSAESVWKNAMETLMLLIAPTAPHMAEELWSQTGHPYSIHNQKWPVWIRNWYRSSRLLW